MRPPVSVGGQDYSKPGFPCHGSVNTSEAGWLAGVSRQLAVSLHVAVDWLVQSFTFMSHAHRGGLHARAERRFAVSVGCACGDGLHERGGGGEFLCLRRVGLAWRRLSEPWICEDLREVRDLRAGRSFRTAWEVGMRQVAEA